MGIFSKKPKEEKKSDSVEENILVDPATIEIDIQAEIEKEVINETIEKQEVPEITETPLPEKKEDILAETVGPLITSYDAEYKTHNSIFFFKFAYKNARLFIDAEESGFLSMEVPDAELNFGHILDEINEAKGIFITKIDLAYPGLKLEINSISIVTFSKIIEEVKWKIK